MIDFIGCKILLLNGDNLISILRDDIKNINFPNMWDLPGGAREGQETPEECICREVKEELGITLKPDSIIFQKDYPSVLDDNQRAYFQVAKILSQDIKAIVFGDEGQQWRLMPIPDFLNNPHAIEPLKTRIRDYLESEKK